MLGLNADIVMAESAPRRASRFARTLSGRFHTSGVSGSMQKHRAQLAALEIRQTEDRDNPIPAGVALQLSRREEEFRADAERLAQLQARLEQVQRDRQLRETRRAERAERKLRYEAACTIQRAMQRYIRRKKDEAVNAIIEFLRTAYAVRAIHVASWAASTLSRLSGLGRRWLEARRMKEKQAMDKFLLQLTIERLVQQSMEAAVDSVAAATMRMWRLDGPSFFVTQQESPVIPDTAAPEVPPVPEIVPMVVAVAGKEAIVDDAKVAEEVVMTGAPLPMKGVVEDSSRQVSSRRPPQEATSGVRVKKPPRQMHAVVQRICEEQRMNAKRIAMLREERKRMLQVQMETQRREEQDRERELRLMFKEDHWQQREQRRRWKRLQAAEKASMETATKPPPIERLGPSHRIVMQSSPIIVPDPVPLARKPEVFKQPSKVVETLKYLVAKETELQQQEEEYERLVAQQRRAEAIEREKQALQQRLQARALQKKEEETAALREKERVEREKDAIGKRAVLARERSERQTIRQLKVTKTPTSPLLASSSTALDEEDDVLLKSLSEPTPILTPGPSHSHPIASSPEAKLYMNISATSQTKPQLFSITKSQSSVKHKSIKQRASSLKLPKTNNKRIMLEPMKTQDMASSYSSLMELIDKARKTLRHDDEIITAPPLLVPTGGDTLAGTTLPTNANLKGSVKFDGFLGQWRKINPPPTLRRFSSVSLLQPVVESTKASSPLVPAVLAEEQTQEAEELELESQLNIECNSLLAKLQMKMHSHALLEELDAPLERSFSAPGQSTTGSGGTAALPLGES